MTWANGLGLAIINVSEKDLKLKSSPCAGALYNGPLLTHVNELSPDGTLPWFVQTLASPLNLSVQIKSARPSPKRRLR